MYSEAGVCWLLWWCCCCWGLDAVLLVSVGGGDAPDVGVEDPLDAAEQAMVEASAPKSPVHPEVSICK
jgi:hypothetical protein